MPSNCRPTFDKLSAWGTSSAAAMPADAVILANYKRFNVWHTVCKSTAWAWQYADYLNVFFLLSVDCLNVPKFIGHLFVTYA